MWPLPTLCLGTESRQGGRKRWQELLVHLTLQVTESGESPSDPGDFPPAEAFKICLRGEKNEEEERELLGFQIRLAFSLKSQAATTPGSGVGQPSAVGGSCHTVWLQEPRVSTAPHPDPANNNNPSSHSAWPPVHNVLKASDLNGRGVSEGFVDL